MGTNQRITDQTDSELMDAYLAGSESAFEELYRRYSSKVYGYLRSRVADARAADDLFQGVFLKIHQSRARFDPKYPFQAWLFTICRNALTDHFRKRGREKAAVGDLESQMDVLQPAVAGAEDETGQVDLGILTPAQKQAVELRYRSELSFDEIAAKLETSPGNVRQMISRAVRRLRAGARK